MFTVTRQSLARRAFSTNAVRNDMAKCILIGRLGKAPEVRTNRNGREYVSYTVATNSTLADGTTKLTWHNINAYNSQAVDFLTTLPKGSLVYVESQMDIREPDASADPSTPQGQRFIFLRHDFLRLLRRGPGTSDELPEQHLSEGSAPDNTT